MAISATMDYTLGELRHLWNFYLCKDVFALYDAEKQMVETIYAASSAAHLGD